MAFAKGQSGNPGGRPKMPQDIRDAARAHSVAAINSLAKIATSGKSESARVAAATAILDRGWGKPSQPIEGGDRPIGFIDVPTKETREEWLSRVATAAGTAVSGNPGDVV